MTALEDAGEHVTFAGGQAVGVHPNFLERTLTRGYPNERRSVSDVIAYDPNLLC